MIPVWNLPQALSALLAQIGDLGIFDEVIVADDGSDPPCDPAQLGFDDAAVGARLTYLRADAQHGAGHARNRGLAAVRSDYVLFFDSDDRMMPALAEIWAAVRAHLADPETPGFDFAIFRHGDTRVRDRIGSFAADERLWDRVVPPQDAATADAAGMADEATPPPLYPLSLQDRAHLAGVAAYPWNKIYRTGFLRSHDIRCSETPVHNDLALHWMSFVQARHVIALRQVGAIHVVDTTGAHHLTNRRGADRLCVFGIFSEIFARIRRGGQDAMLFAAHFLRFAHDLCRWIRDRLDAPLRDVFTERARRYLAQTITPDEFAAFAYAHPDRADQMVQFLGGRRAL